MAVLCCILSSIGAYFAFSNANVSSQKVTFYQDCDYKGNATELGKGTYRVLPNNLTNDAISSVKVPNGLKVTLYEHGDLKGKTLVLTSDTKCLNSEYNDKTSSIEIT
jgi:hypothetical protein